MVLNECIRLAKVWWHRPQVRQCRCSTAWPRACQRNCYRQSGWQADPETAAAEAKTLSPAVLHLSTGCCPGNQGRASARSLSLLSHARSLAGLEIPGMKFSSRAEPLIRLCHGSGKAAQAMAREVAGTSEPMIF